MDDLYRENILEHYKKPHHWGELEDPDFEFFDSNPLCGDELKVQIKVDADATPDQLARLREEVEARCPVSDNITNATPVSIEMVAA